MELVLKGSHDTKIAATSPQSPEQVRILVGTGCDQAPIGGYHIHRSEVVANQPVLAHQQSVTACQCQSRDSGRAHDPAGCRKPIGVRLVVKVPPCSASLGASCLPLGIDTHSSCGRQVDHEATIANSEARNAVATPTY